MITPLDLQELQAFLDETEQAHADNQFAVEEPPNGPRAGTGVSARIAPTPNAE